MSRDILNSFLKFIGCRGQIKWLTNQSI